MTYSALDILQALGFSKSSAHLVITSTKGRAEISINNGNITNLTGCDADVLFDYLIEKTPSILVTPIDPSAPQNMCTSISALTLELAHRYDQQRFIHNTSNDKISIITANELKIFHDGDNIKIEDSTPISKEELTRKMARKTFTSDEINRLLGENPKRLIFQENDNCYLLLGRSQECNLLSLDPLVSRVHCGITFSGQRFHIQDLNSRNGTFINGIRITDCLAEENDVLTIGHDSFVLGLEKSDSNGDAPGSLPKPKRTLTPSIS